MNKNTIDGSTALRPQREQKNLEEERKISERKKRELLNKKRYASLRRKLWVIASIGITFSISMILVMRFAFICNLRQQVTDTQKQVATLNKENENLKVELLKYDNIKYVEKIALEKLNMQRPNLGNAVYCDLETKYFKEDTNDKNKKGENKISIIEFIKSKLF